MTQKVLVTGASGFIAAHIIQQLYAKGGYSVVGTVRSDEKGQFFVKQYPEFQYEIVKDLSQLDAFEHVFKSHPDVDYVLHTASPFHFNGTDPQKDLIDPAINGTLSILQAAKKYGPNVKKIVITSSFAAVMQFPPDKVGPSFVYNEKVWNNITKEQSTLNLFTGYVASKTFAERSAWEFVETEKPQFNITTIQVPFVFGPPINDIGIKNLNTSNAAVYGLLNPDQEDQDFEGMKHYIDVRDCAKTHIISMTESGLDNKRCLSIAGLANGQLLADTIRKIRPELADRIVKGKPGSFSADNFDKVDNSESQKYLKIDYIPLEKTLNDLVDRLLELEKQQ